MLCTTYYIYHFVESFFELLKLVSQDLERLRYRGHGRRRRSDLGSQAEQSLDQVVMVTGALYGQTS